MLPPPPKNYKISSAFSCNFKLALTQLRHLGVDEKMIQQLRTYDWEQFKKERSFYERQEVSDEKIQWKSKDFAEQIGDAENLLNSIENERLLTVLQKADKQTLEILVLRLKGYSYKQIAEKYGMQEMAVINRIARLRKRLKKIF